MGAMLWHHQVPWEANVSAALRTLQEERFHREYNFTAELDMWHQDAEQVLAAEQDSGDIFGLVAIYSEYLKTVEEVRSKPPPQTIEAQIAALRRVLPEDYGSILDVTGVDEAGGEHVMRPLSLTQTRELFGTECPTLADVRKSVYIMADRIGRGESVAFPACDDPAGQLIGCSSDALSINRSLKNIRKGIIDLIFQKKQRRSGCPRGEQTKAFNWSCGHDSSSSPPFSASCRIVRRSGTLTSRHFTAR